MNSLDEEGKEGTKEDKHGKKKGQKEDLEAW